MPFIIVGSHLALDIMVGKHGVVENDTALGRVTLLPVFVVIIDAVDVYDSFIVLS